jgi:uncharacterized protein YjbI with pentapeptide repeats
MITTKTIGNRIAEARKKMNISQTQLAQRLFISSQAVGKWERGESMPDVITLSRLAEIFNVELTYFTMVEQTNNEALEPQAGNLLSDDKKNSSISSNKTSWDMSNSNWVSADFSGLKNLHEKFNSSNMQQCLFVGSDLSGLILKGNNIENCDFSGSNLSNSMVRYSNLSKSKLNNCLLTGTQFTGSFIEGCDLTGADFTGVTIKLGGISGLAGKIGEPEKNTVVDAIWHHTSFIGSHIAGLVFTGTFKDCSFENCAFSKVTFKDSTLINTFFKNNKNLKKLQFINCKADRLTYEFLKQGKADLNGIELLKEVG